MRRQAPHLASGVPSFELDHLAKPEDGHGELSARGHAFQEIPNASVIGHVSHRDAVHLQDDIAADNELLAHDGGQYSAASQADRLPG